MTRTSSWHQNMTKGRVATPAEAMVEAVVGTSNRSTKAKDSPDGKSHHTRWHKLAGKRILARENRCVVR